MKSQSINCAKLLINAQRRWQRAMRSIEWRSVRSPAIALKMARGRVRNDVGHHDNPPRDFARLWPAPRPNKNGVPNARPHYASPVCSGRLLLFRGHRLVLFYWRWFGLVVFERDDFFRPGSQLRVVLFRVFSREL